LHPLWSLTKSAGQEWKSSTHGQDRQLKAVTELIRPYFLPGAAQSNKYNLSAGLSFTQNGIDIALNQGTPASVHVLDTVLKNNGGVGVRAANAVAPNVQVGIDHTRAILDNVGFDANTNSRMVINNSVAENATSDGMKADASTGQLTVANSDSSFNGNGITASAGGSVNVVFSNVAYNTTCAFNNSASSFATFGNNRIIGTANCGTITPASQQ